MLNFHHLPRAPRCYQHIVLSCNNNPCEKKSRETKDDTSTVPYLSYSTWPGHSERHTRVYVMRAWTARVSGPAFNCFFFHTMEIHSKRRLDIKVNYAYAITVILSLYDTPHSFLLIPDTNEHVRHPRRPP